MKYKFTLLILLAQMPALLVTLFGVTIFGVLEEGNRLYYELTKAFGDLGKALFYIYTTVTPVLIGMFIDIANSRGYSIRKFVKNSKIRLPYILYVFLFASYCTLLPLLIVNSIADTISAILLFYKHPILYQIRNLLSKILPLRHYYVRN